MRHTNRPISTAVSAETIERELADGLALPSDLLLYAKTLSYLFALARELAPEVDPMRLSVPHLLRFLAQRDPAPTSVAAAAGPGGG